MGLAPQEGAWRRDRAAVISPRVFCSPASVQEQFARMLLQEHNGFRCAGKLPPCCEIALVKLMNAMFGRIPVGCQGHNPEQPTRPAP